MPDLAEELDGLEPSAKDKLAELERLAEELHGAGIDFRVEQGRVQRVAAGIDRDRETVLDLGKEHIRIAFVSDTHAGSKFEQLTALRAFYRYADGAGPHPETGKGTDPVDFFVHAGDWTQGTDKMHRGMVHEVHAHEAEAQMAYTIATFPRSERGVPTYGITGNHDDSFLKDGGVNVLRAISQSRPDIVYIGQDAAYLTVGTLRAYVIHPDGGGAYAKSYKPQKVAEALPIDRKLALIAIGHYHSWGLFKHQRSYALMLPCFQGQYSWMARKGLFPDIGGLIVDLWLDDNGWPRRFRQEFVSFPSIDDDWDTEISREVSRGWTSKGLEVA